MPWGTPLRRTRRDISRVRILKLAILQEGALVKSRCYAHERPKEHLRAALAGRKPVRGLKLDCVRVKTKGLALRVWLDELDLVDSGGHQMSRAIMTRERRHIEARSDRTDALSASRENGIHFRMNGPAKFDQIADTPLAYLHTQSVAANGIGNRLQLGHLFDEVVDNAICSFVLLQ